MKLILGGHWTAAPAGWQTLSEREQDITRPLPWASGSVDVIFTEHVIEHITFIQAVGFMREAFRVLKPGGIFRCVAPMTHVFTRDDFRPAFLERYAREQMAPYYVAELMELAKLGLDFSNVDLAPWRVDFLVRKHGHQFCWSSLLMVDVLRKIGFSNAYGATPGFTSFDPSNCLERRIRGTHAENLERDFGQGIVFDPESGVVEAQK